MEGGVSRALRLFHAEQLKAARSSVSLQCENAEGLHVTYRAKPILEPRKGLHAQVTPAPGGYRGS